MRATIWTVFILLLGGGPPSRSSDDSEQVRGGEFADRGVDVRDLSAYEQQTPLPSGFYADVAARLESDGVCHRPRALRVEGLKEERGGATIVANIVLRCGAIERRREFFIRAALNLDPFSRRVVDATVLETIPINEVDLRIEVSLTELVAVARDRAHDIIFVYPIGGPGFDRARTPRTRDAGVTTLLAPIFDGYAPKKLAVERRGGRIYERTKAPIFKQKPFIRIMRKGHPWSVLAFHIDPDSDTLDRGFYSAGCFRMREPDLDELYSLVRYGKRIEVPVTVRRSLAEPIEHPYPRIDDSYHAVTGYKPIENDRFSFRTRLFEGGPPVAEVDWNFDFWP